MHNDTTTVQLQNQSSILIADGKMRIKIPIKNILFIKAEHVYVRIHLINDQRLLHRCSMERIISQLPANDFIQIHRSYIANMNFIEGRNNDHIALAGHQLPISRTRRRIVKEKLSRA